MEMNVDSETTASLQGNALRIYWYLLRSSSPSGIRSIQRALKLSSPSLVRHHLDRLEQDGLVQQTEEGYTPNRNVRVDALEMFIGLGRLQIPRQIFYLTFFTTLLIFYIVFAAKMISVESVLLIGALLFGLISSGYEVWRVWRSAPW